MAAPQNLALAFEQMLTVIVRVRSHRQAASNPDVFRAHVRGLLKTAEREALAAGYSMEDYRLACFAVVAFLDESLNVSGDAVFGDWRRLPLQQELFKTGNAGEEFFKYLEAVLKRRDTPQLADLLEVFQLCLLLGFQGRGSSEFLRSFKEGLGERIRRIRGPAKPLSTSWAPSGGAVPAVGPDPWVRRLAVAAGACFLLAVALWVSFKLLLNAA